MGRCLREREQPVLRSKLKRKLGALQEHKEGSYDYRWREREKGRQPAGSQVEKYLESMLKILDLILGAIG